LLQQSASGLGIDQNLQRHRAVSLRQHGFLVVHIHGNRVTVVADRRCQKISSLCFGRYD